MQLIKKMSRSWSNFSVQIILLSAFTLCKFASCELESPNNGALEEMQNPVQEQINIPETILIRKCCPENHILVEYDFGHRSCQLRTKYATDDRHSPTSDWEPQFYRYPSLSETIGPRTFEIAYGEPTCDGSNEHAFHFHEIDPKIDDTFRLLENGSLSHKGTIHKFYEGRDDLLEKYISGEKDDVAIEVVEDITENKECVLTKDKQERVLYPPEKYCIDEMILDYKSVNTTSSQPLLSNGVVVEFAMICIHHKVDIVEKYLYPSCISVSILCLIMTFLLYSVLPQLRDLTGKFILGICGFSVSAFALTLIDIFGVADKNVHRLTTEFLLHTSIVGLWFCLNCMGHHVWQIIRSKSVFTRISDGKRLRYYSVYIFTLTGVISAIAASVHFLVEVEEKDDVCETIDSRYRIGWSTLAAFYIPVAMILLVNIYFYWTSQRTMAKQLIYNRNMQHFQVNFDLYTKFLVVVGIWWLFHSLSLLRLPALNYIAMVFNVLHGPLIFLVAMCRTRVSFLFKRYFCVDECWCCCCKGGGNFAATEFIEEECQELATIDMLKERLDESNNEIPETKRLTNGIFNGTLGRSVDVDKELTTSLFNVKNSLRREPGDVLPPPDPDAPIGRVRRLLKSNSLTALANINFGWRRETSV